MKFKLPNRLGHFQIWLPAVIVAVLMTESIVMLMSWLLKGAIEPDYMIAGFVASVAVASVVSAAIVHLQEKVTERRAMAEALQKEYDFFTKLTSQVPGIVFQYELNPDGEGAFPYASAAINEICGVSPEEAREDARAIFSKIPPNDLANVLATLNASAQTLQPWSCEFRFSLEDVADRWLLCHALPEKSTEGKLLWHGFIADITENKHREVLLRQSEERFRSLFENAEKIPVQGYNSEHRVIFWNKASEELYGYSREEALGRRLEDLIIPESQRDGFAQAMEDWIKTGVPISSEETELQKKCGAPVSVLTSHTMLVNSTGGREMYRIDMDMTERKKADELIWRQANFDPLTGLPNRRMLYDRLEQEIKKAIRSHLKVALMFLDLDRFKEVNDTLGHDMGDALLRNAAMRIVSCVRDTDTVARLGGDEFTVILEDLQDPQNVERVAQGILDALAEPFQLGNEMAYVSASIGITIYPDDADQIEQLLKNADQAMYAAKRQGRNRCSYFTPSLQEAAQSRRRIAMDLHAALAEQQFFLVYQPIVELESGIIHKAEALLRWQHPEHGLVKPESFIPVAEETGLIVDIGDWVFRQVARQVAQWREKIHPAFQISINKSPAQFHNVREGHQNWFAFLTELGLPGQSILVEITEGLLLDISANVTNQLLEMRDSGMQVSLDDFGTGYSSLTYLKRLDIDYLKIDQSFIRNLAPGAEDLALCEAILVMAHKLGIRVIAEGVETEAQLDLLKQIGCDYGQGYYFATPLLPHEFEGQYCGGRFKH